MRFQLKQAEVKDVDVLAAMRLEMRKERESVACPVSDEEFLQKAMEFFRVHIADGTFVSFIAWDGDQAAACSGLSFHVHPPTFDNLSGKQGYITNMYTRPAWRRMGVATLLVDKLAEFAREEGCAKLFLNASPMGQTVYVRYGFKPVDGEMALEL